MRVVVRPNDGEWQSGHIIASTVRGLAFAFGQQNAVKGAHTDKLMQEEGHRIEFPTPKAAEAFILAAERTFTDDFLEQVDIFQRFKPRKKGR